MFTFGNIAILILVGVVAILGGKHGFNWLFAKDTEKENRRRAAFKLAAQLKAYGLNRIPDFLGDYAVGDYSGMFEQIHDLAKVAVADPTAIVKELEQVYTNILKVKLSSEEGRAYLSAQLSAAALPSAPLPAPVDLKTPVK